MTDLLVENIHQTLGTTRVLDGASFAAERGRIVGLLGASGSGKTTLLRAIAGHEQPQIGRIVIGDRPVFDSKADLVLPPEQRDIGLVFQSYALWPHRTVMENVWYGLRLRGVAKGEAQQRSRELLDRLGLQGLGERYPHQLSGGQQQRAALCRSLVYNPRVLLLDEPLSNLDAKLREEARFWIRQLILDLEICAVVVTHDQLEALSMCDEILLLADGRIVETGTPEEIYERPKTLLAAEFMGVNNVFEGRLAAQQGENARIEGDGWTLEGILKTSAANGDRVTVITRVDQTRLVDADGPNRVSVTLAGSVYHGGYFEHVLALGAQKIRARGDSRITCDVVWCEMPKMHVWVFAA